MKRTFLLLTLFIFTGLFNAAVADNLPSDTSKSDLQALPELTLKDVDGNNIFLPSYAAEGKITIISFWATWCKPCIKELKNVDALLEEWQEKYNVQLVAVSIDNARNTLKVKPTVAGNGWEFDILMDPNGDLQRAMNVTNPPVTFLVDQKGKIVYTHTGYLEGDEYDLEKEIQKLK